MSKLEIPVGTMRIGKIHKEGPIDTWIGHEWASMSMKNFEGAEGQCNLARIYFQIVNREKFQLIEILKKYDLTKEDKETIEEMLK